MTEGLSKTGNVYDKRNLRPTGDNYNGHNCSQCGDSTRVEEITECTMCKSVILKKCTVNGKLCKRRCHDAIWTIWTRKEKSIPKTTPGTSVMMTTLKETKREHYQKNVQANNDEKTLEVIDKLPKERDVELKKTSQTVVTTTIDKLADAAKKGIIKSCSDSNLNRELYDIIPEKYKKHLPPRGQIEYKGMTPLMENAPEPAALPSLLDRSKDKVIETWQQIQGP